MPTLTTEQTIAILRDTALFTQLSDDDILKIIETFHRVTISAGEVVIEEGTVANSMYIVLSGRLQVQSLATQHLINTLNAGDVVGELGLLTEQNRTATMTTLENTELLECSRRDVEHLLETYPEIGQTFRDMILPRVRRLYMLSALLKLIGDISLEEIEAFEARTEWIHLKRDEVLFAASQQQDDMYLLVQGRLRAIAPDDNRTVIGEIEAGETVGELGLLSDEPRIATVKAIRDSYLIRIDRGDYDFLAKTHPHISTNIAQIVIKRQQAMLKQQRVKRAESITYALIPLDNKVDTLDLAEQLQTYMKDFGTTKALDSTGFDKAYGYNGASNLPDDHPISIIVDGWMYQFESDNRYVLYIADPSMTEWTQRCIEASDRILLVGYGKGSPDLTAIEKVIQIQYAQVRQELVLLHPEGTEMPSGTANWLDKREVKTHHHIRVNDDKHYRRAARRLTGHATGVVLSGGGARGYVQLGVIRALEEQNVQIDMIAGTSIGALISAAYALHPSADEVFNIAKQFSDSKLIFDYTFPIVALNNSTRVSNLLNRIYGDVDIEDLWIPYFNIASNMSQADMVINKRGTLHRAIRGSMSIPGVFSPVIRDGDIIIDGGIVNNFPIDIMSDWCEGGTVIGLTAQSERPASKRRTFDIEDGVPGWRILLNRLNPFSKNIRVPLLPVTLLKTLEINTLRQQRGYKHLADMLLNVDTHEFGLLDFDDYERITQKGYDTAKPIVEAWLKSQPEYVTVTN